MRWQRPHGFPWAMSFRRWSCFNPLVSKVRLQSLQCLASVKTFRQNKHKWKSMHTLNELHTSLHKNLESGVPHLAKCVRKNIFRYKFLHFGHSSVWCLDAMWRLTSPRVPKLSVQSWNVHGCCLLVLLPSNKNKLYILKTTMHSIVKKYYYTQK